MANALTSSDLPLPSAPVILPLPSEVGFVRRFAFPKVSEPRESPAAKSSEVIWPSCNDAELSRTCGKAADGLLHRLSLDHPTIIGFTSPSDGDGKTRFLLDFAPQLAERLDRGVLVVDANFRRPKLAARLGIVAEEAAGSTALIYPTNVPRLHILTASSAPRAYGHQSAWLGELRDAWPLTLLDMASLAYPETAMTARLCDGVYLVVRLGRTSQRAIKESARVLRRVGGRLLGCIVAE
jgi:Mrp family chromosome partitioning ATPase